MLTKGVLGSAFRLWCVCRLTQLCGRRLHQLMKMRRMQARSRMRGPLTATQATCIGGHAWPWLIAMWALSTSASCAALEQNASRSIIPRTAAYGNARTSAEASDSASPANVADVTSRNFAVSPCSHINVTSQTKTQQHQMPVRMQHKPAVRPTEAHFSEPATAASWQTDASQQGSPTSEHSSNSGWGHLTQRHPADQQLTQTQQQVARRQLLQVDAQALPDTMLGTQPAGPDPMNAEELDGSSFDAGASQARTDRAGKTKLQHNEPIERDLMQMTV